MAWGIWSGFAYFVLSKRYIPALLMGLLLIFTHYGTTFIMGGMAFVATGWLIYKHYNRWKYVTSAVLMLAMVRKLSLLVKITPGNLGFEQLFFGMTTYVFGGDSQTGIVVSLINRLASLIVVFIFGSWYSARNMKYFKISKFRELMHLMSSMKKESL